MTQILRVVAYAVNGAGLGHLTRVLAILRWVRRLARLSGVHPEIYVLTSSEACGLALQEGFAAFKIPSKTAVKKADIVKEDYLRLAKQWVWHSIGLIRPDLMIVDTFPAGSFGELFHALDGRHAKVFIHRALKPEFARLDAIQSMLPLYDRILIPEEPHCSQTPLPDSVAARVKRLGPILLRDREDLAHREIARQWFGVPDGKFAIWLTAGGGGDPTGERSLRILSDVALEDGDVHLVIGAGPLYRGRPIRHPRITWFTGFHAFENFAAIDCAFSAAGFNSFYELLYAGVPTAFFAQEKIADEQIRRVKTAQATGAGLALDIDADGSLDPNAIRQLIAKLRNPELRASLRESAQHLVSYNHARDAAAAALRTALPKLALDQSLEFATPRLYAIAAREGVEIETLEETVKLFWQADDFDGFELEDVILHILEKTHCSGEEALQQLVLFAKRFPKPTTSLMCEELADAAICVINILTIFQDAKAATAFLRASSVEKVRSYRQAAEAMRGFLESLARNGESLWRGLSLLERRAGGDEKFAPAWELMTQSSDEETSNE